MRIRYPSISIDSVASSVTASIQPELSKPPTCSKYFSPETLPVVYALLSHCAKRPRSLETGERYRWNVNYFENPNLPWQCNLFYVERCLFFCYFSGSGQAACLITLSLRLISLHKKRRLAERFLYYERPKNTAWACRRRLHPKQLLFFIKFERVTGPYILLNEWWFWRNGHVAYRWFEMLTEVSFLGMTRNLVDLWTGGLMIVWATVSQPTDQFVIHCCGIIYLFLWDHSNLKSNLFL